MNHLNPQQLLQALEWRYATKVFDATKKIPAEVWTALEQNARPHPQRSYGLQPYHFLIVQDPAKRAGAAAAFLGPEAGGGLFAFCGADRPHRHEGEADVTRLDFTHQRFVRGMLSEVLQTYRDMMLGDVVHGARGKIAHEWATRQTYIALGNLMTAAAVLGVDACPMEGLVPAEYDKILHLQGTGYATVVACALGYRAASDKYAGLAKVRYPTSEVVRVI